MNSLNNNLTYTTGDVGCSQAILQHFRAGFLKEIEIGKPGTENIEKDNGILHANPC